MDASASACFGRARAMRASERVQDACPETIEEYLECPGARVAQFNRCGTLLAFGGCDGRCFLWDFVTRGRVKSIPTEEGEAPFGGGEAVEDEEEDVGDVQGIEWSCDGRTLLCWDGTAILKLWNVLDGEEEAQVVMKNLPVRAKMHPENQRKCLVCLADGKAMAVELQGNGTKTELCDAGKQVVDLVYTNRGKAVLLACKDGQLQEVIEVGEGQFENGRHLQLVASIRKVSLSLDEKVLLVHCEDEVLRLVNLNEVFNVGRECSKIRGKKKVPWKCACLSSCNTYVLAAANSASEQHIYVWNRKNGTLEAVLEGPHEGVEDMLWHPEKDILLTVCNSGYSYIWAKAYVENWSAFAPDFQELSHNVEYVEREDEFDLNGREDEEEEKPATIEEVDDGTWIDIEGGVQKAQDDYLHYLPVEIEAEVEDKSVAPAKPTLEGGARQPAANGDASGKLEDSVLADGDTGKRKKKPRTSDTDFK